jgi:hypothetical protein
VFVADQDYTNKEGPIPGMGKIVCRQADALTAARVARATFTLLKWVLEF